MNYDRIPRSTREKTWACIIVNERIVKLHPDVALMEIEGRYSIFERKLAKLAGIVYSENTDVYVYCAQEKQFVRLRSDKPWNMKEVTVFCFRRRFSVSDSLEPTDAEKALAEKFINSMTTFFGKIATVEADTIPLSVTGCESEDTQSPTTCGNVDEIKKDIAQLSSLVDTMKNELNSFRQSITDGSFRQDLIDEMTKNLALKANNAKETVAVQKEQTIPDEDEQKSAVVQEEHVGDETAESTIVHEKETTAPESKESAVASEKKTEELYECHHDAICDKCGNWINGMRYKCLWCTDFDLCSNCFESEEMQNKHAHPFGRFKSGDDIINPRADIHRGIRCDGPCCEHKKTSILGDRYSCTVCDNFDLCSKCVNNTVWKHDPSHLLVVKKTSTSAPVECIERRTEISQVKLEEKDELNKDFCAQLSRFEYNSYQGEATMTIGFQNRGKKPWPANTRLKCQAYYGRRRPSPVLKEAVNPGESVTLFVEMDLAEQELKGDKNSDFSLWSLETPNGIEFAKKNYYHGMKVDGNEVLDGANEQEKEETKREETNEKDEQIHEGSSSEEIGRTHEGSSSREIEQTHEGKSTEKIEQTHDENPAEPTEQIHDENSTTATQERSTTSMSNSNDSNSTTNLGESQVQMFKLDKEISTRGDSPDDGYDTGSEPCSSFESYSDNDQYDIVNGSDLSEEDL